MYLGILGNQVNWADTTDPLLDPEDEFTLPPFDSWDFFYQYTTGCNPFYEPFPENSRDSCGHINNGHTPPGSTAEHLVSPYIGSDHLNIPKPPKVLDPRCKYIGFSTTSSENLPQNFDSIQWPLIQMAESAPATPPPKKSASARQKAKAKKQTPARSPTPVETPAPETPPPQALVPEALTPAEVYTAAPQGSAPPPSPTNSDTDSYRSSHGDYFSDNEEDTSPQEYNLLVLWLIWLRFIIDFKMASMKAAFISRYRAKIGKAPHFVQRACEFAEDCADAAIDWMFKGAMWIVNRILDAKMWLLIAWDILMLIKGRFITPDGNVVISKKYRSIWSPLLFLVILGTQIWLPWLTAVGADRVSFFFNSLLTPRPTASLTPSQIVQFGNYYCENEHPELTAVGASLVQRHPSLTHSCTVSANNDVTGLGIRYLVYITVFCRMVLASFAHHYAAITRVSSQILANCSLLALSFCMFYENISLPHSLAALQLAGIIIWPNFIIEPQRSYSPRSFILQQILLNGYFIIGVWVQILAPCMGSDPQCSHLIRRSIMGIVYFAASYETRKAWVRLYFNLWCWNLWRLFTAPGIYVHMRAFVDVFSEEGSIRWAQEEKRRRAEFVEWHFKDTEDQPWWFQFGRIIVLWAYVDEDCPDLPWHVEDNTPFRKRMANWLYSTSMMKFVPALAMLVWLVHSLEDLCNTSLDAEESKIANFGQIFAMAQALEMVVLMVWFLFYPERKGCVTGCFVHRTSRECMHCVGKRKEVNGSR
jgi:hypothetical protein